MIGMMYLFYTALLALNISAEVIEAFVKIDTSINQTTVNFSSKTKALYATIDNKAREQPTKRYKDLATEAHRIEAESLEVYNFLDELKAELILHSDGEGSLAIIRDENNKIIAFDLDKIKKKDDAHGGTVLMGPEGGKKGAELHEKISIFRTSLLKLVSDSTESVYRSINSGLATYEGVQQTKDGPRTWEEKFYLGMPLVGTLALLSKLQADVRNAEADILEYKIRDLEGLDIRITALEGLISTSTSFVVRGGEYQSKIFLGALDTTMRPTIHLTHSFPFWDSIVENGDVRYKLREGISYDTLLVDASGKGTYRVSCGSVGDFKYGGLINYKSNKGDKWLPFVGQYQVGEAGFTVSATKCNVFYKGLENPVAVSVSGYPKEGISVSISGGASIHPAQGGGYIVIVPPSVTAKEVTVSVSVKTPEGGKNLGSSTFKVFDVPPPSIMIAGAYKDGSRMPKSAIKNSPMLTARLGEGFFPFEGVKYNVSSFDFVFSVRGVAGLKKVPGSRLTEDVLAEITKMGAGQTLTFTNIFYTGPSGTKQTNGVTVILE
jgi:gliding motility-associated protein GldM